LARSLSGVTASTVCSTSTCTLSSTSSVNCPSGSDAQSACTLACTTAGSTSGSWTCDSGSSSSTCFSADMTVELSNGTTLRMDEITVGDNVLVNANKEYSDVFMFSHRLSAVNAEFVSLTTDNGANIKLTGNHYLYVNGRMAIASTVQVGDKLQSKDGKATTVTAVATVRADGLYNPNTLHGDIVVNGIVASTYTSDINPTLAHAALMPVRMAYKLGGDIVGHAFDNGSDLIAAALPDGKAKY